MINKYISIYIHIILYIFLAAWMLCCICIFMILLTQLQPYHETTTYCTGYANILPSSTHPVSDSKTSKDKQL